MNEYPQLPPYAQIESFLESERKVLLSTLQFSDTEEGEELAVRPLDQAKAIFTEIKNLQIALWEAFKDYPQLSEYFGKDFIPFPIFFQRDYIVDICFVSDFLFPDKDLMEFSKGNKLELAALQGHCAYLIQWATQKVDAHKETQVFLREKFDTEVRRSEITCQCTQCSADFRTKLREALYFDCVQEIEETANLLKNNLDRDIQYLSTLFLELQKGLDRKLHTARSRLKRGTYNKLEGQIKGRVKGVFQFPSALAQEYCQKQLTPFFRQKLRAEGLNPDLIEQEELDRFYIQLSRNIWRGERYLEGELKKLIKSVLLLKRKDISATILKEYLGEFWLHSEARKMNRRIIYHMGPTNSGKTYHAIQAVCKVPKGCYLAPLRLLASELYDTMNQMGVKTTLLTGEEVIEVEDATHYSSTIEMARFNEVFDCCVIDEIQMITDPQRGWAWTRALVNIVAQEIHICGDHSALDLVEQIVALCGDKLEIKNYERMTELKVEDGQTILGDLQRSDAVIVFSRKKALQYKHDLERCGFNVSVVYGRLSPEVRREQARKFDENETDIIVSTDAIAMGMNLPIKRIVFTSLTKHIDGQDYDISESEIKQIAGRAGRYKRFPVGSVTCLTRVEDGINRIKEALKCDLPQKKECMIGPDLDIFTMVNRALHTNALPELKLSEFLRLFNTMSFKKPFQCVDLKEMIELAEMVEEADQKHNLSNAEIFGFACAPVNLGMIEHVEYYMWILNHYSNNQGIFHEPIEYQSHDIDYLEVKIKCVELFQWLSRHFNNKNFNFSELELLDNKGRAISRLNELLSEKVVPKCNSCGKQLAENSRFAICEECFKQRRFTRRPSRPSGRVEGNGGQASDRKKPSSGQAARPSSSSTSSSRSSKGGAKGRGRSQKSTKRFR